MRIVRDGGRRSVYSRGRRYVRDHRGDFDVIIDEINTVPFHAYRVAREKPVLALIHQLAREIWFYETRFPLSAIGYVALEPLWLREYRHTTTITVSQSTMNDLQKHGFEQVHIVQNGLGVAPLEKVPEKAPYPVMIYLGRLVRSKLPEHAILAFQRVKASHPNTQLWLLGEGYLRERLESMHVDGVKFFGRVDHKEKFELLKQAHVLLSPSVREGWGLSVIEANAMGTPAVGYSVPGLRDSILNGATGFLVKDRDPVALGDAAEKILTDSTLANNLSREAIEWSKKFSWDDSARQFDAVVKSAVGLS